MPDHKLTLSHTARTDIAHYIRMCNYEIGGFGYVTINDSGDFFVDEIFLVEQTVTGTTVDFMDDGLAYAVERAAKDDRLDELKFCWHSHVNMGAFWSGTDETMITGMNNGMTPYIVSLVQNKKHETKQRVDFFPQGNEFSSFTDQVTFDLDLFYQVPEAPKHITQAYNALVTHAKPVTMPHAKRSVHQFSDHKLSQIQEQVAKDGYNSLDISEKDAYDDMLYELAIKQHSNMWDDDFYGYNAHGQLDTTPLSDISNAKD